MILVKTRLKRVVEKMVFFAGSGIDIRNSLMWDGIR